MNVDTNIEAISFVIFGYMTSNLVYLAQYSLSYNSELEFFLSHLAKGCCHFIGFEQPSRLTIVALGRVSVRGCS